MRGGNMRGGRGNNSMARGNTGNRFNGARGARGHAAPFPRNDGTTETESRPTFSSKFEEKKNKFAQTKARFYSIWFLVF